MKAQKNLPFIPYKQENNAFAKYNRLHPTKAESKIWEEYLKWRPCWYKFTRQKPLEALIVDFYCTKLMLVIEVDGDSHIGRWYYDEIKEAKLAEYGILVRGYTNTEVLNDMNYIQRDLEKCIQEREKLFVN